MRHFFRPTVRRRFESPEVCGHRTEFVCQTLSLTSIVDRRLNLPAMANDTAVAQQFLNSPGCKPCDLRDVKASEGPSKVVSLIKDRSPAQPGLEPFQADLLEQSLIIVDWETPFLVVIRQERWLRFTPPTTNLSVWPLMGLL
jgi:hypothetical protein